MHTHISDVDNCMLINDAKKVYENKTFKIIGSN